MYAFSRFSGEDRTGSRRLALPQYNCSLRLVVVTPKGDGFVPQKTRKSTSGLLK